MRQTALLAQTVVSLTLALASEACSSPGGLDEAFDLARDAPNLTSLVVAHDGVIEREAYFNGGGADLAQDVRSVTKSVTALLVGIALERGCLQSLDQTVGELLGGLGPADPTTASITLRQLLTMTGGLGGDELADPGLYNRWAAAPDQLAYVWTLPLAAAPGTQFNYYSATYYVLSRILTQACSTATATFAAEALFGPLGVPPREWETDDSGYYNGGAGLSLTPHDMVAVGNLVLARGSAGGVAVVPGAWIDDATTPRVATSAMSHVTGYGYGWWTGRADGSDYALATGWGGQFIVVVPDRGLVVTAATLWQGTTGAAAGAQWSRAIEIILGHVLPAYPAP